MNRDSLLPRSLFSASTLKREPVEETIESVTLQPSPPSPARRSEQQQQKQQHGQEFEALTASTSSSVEANNQKLGKSKSSNRAASRHRDESSNESHSSSSSSSSSEDEDEDIEMKMLRQDHVSAAHINHTMHHLLLKLERQQSKQNRYLEKFKHLSKAIKKTSRLIGYNANLLAETSQLPNTTKRLPQLAKRSSHFETTGKEKQRKIALVDSDNDKSDDEVIEQIPKLPIASTSKPPTKSRANFPTSKISAVKKVYKEIEFGQYEKMDLFAVRKITSEQKFSKKPRSLLYNIADGNSGRGLSELMIATSLDGELQFWNAKDRREIKTIGKDHLYDTWIDDICWATPTTLAFSPPQKSEEPVKLVHIGNVTQNNVEGRIQTLDEAPHENGISVIASLNTGDYNTRNTESCSFVTGGYDKSVYLWSLKRESPEDNFTSHGVNRLNIRHTSAVQALCYDKYRNILFSGGADERLVIFDVQTNSTLREMRLAQRITQLIQSKANPNIMLITISLRADQFSIYDQRCPGFEGIKLRFGQQEQENLSRFVKPDMHENGYTVSCGSQCSAKLNFWDIRYANVSRSPSFSMNPTGTTRILKSLFIPRSESVVAISSLKKMIWFDYQVERDQIVQSLA